MTSGPVQKTSEYSSPLKIGIGASRSELELRGIKELGTSGKKSETLTFRAEEEGNPQQSAVKYQSRDPSPLSSSQLSLKKINMDQLYNRDPNFDPVEYRMRNHTPTKRALEIPGEKRNKVQDARLLKDLIANQAGTSFSDRVKESLEDAQLKQELLTLREEVSLLKLQINKIERETQRDSVQSAESPYKNAIRSAASLAGSPGTTTRRERIPSTAVSLRQSRAQPPTGNAKVSSGIESYLDETATKSQKFSTPQPHRSQQGTVEDEMRSSPSKESPQRFSENSPPRFYNPLVKDYRDPTRSDQQSPKRHLRTQSSNAHTAANSSYNRYQSPSTYSGGSPGRPSARLNYSALTSFPPYYKKEALYRPRYSNITTQHPKQDNNTSLTRSDSAGPKMAATARTATPDRKITHSPSINNGPRPFSPSVPSHTNNPNQTYVKLNPAVTDRMPIQSQSSNESIALIFLISF